MRSIRWKLVIMYIALVFLVMISSGTFMIVSIFTNEKQKAERDLKDIALMIEEQILAEYADIDAFLADVQNERVTRVTTEDWSIILGKNSMRVVYNSMEPDLLNLPQDKTSVVSLALSGETGVSVGRQYPNPNEDNVLKRCAELAKPKLNADGEVEYVLYIRKDASYIYDNMLQIVNTIALAVVIALVATVIIGILFASTLTKPIAMLTRTAKEFAGGHLEQEISVNSKDEIGQLTESFNNMAKDLTQTISEMESEKNKLEVVLYNMTDGVVAYDASGRVVHANHVCTELLDIKDMQEVPFMSLLQQLGQEMEGEAEVDLGALRDTTVSIGERYIHATFNTYSNKEGHLDGVIIVLQDITRHMKLDNMRKEFVANVSHEIRTPLTTIKSYTETLIDGALAEPGVAESFLQTINAEADRMTRIVKDLLQLSQLDNSKMELKMQTVNLVALARQNVGQHAVTASRIKKTVTFTTSLESMVVEIDPERINQVLNNIVSNALKYSGENAKVDVVMEDAKQYYRVYVQDNGMGIPKEDLRRIFERFYRVDKARSRQLGGTGLGLSIAKEIMEAHGGKISASSELGRGTTMILRFPKDVGVALED